MRRTLGLFDVTCIGLNAIVGSGIFALPDDLYREMGALSPLAFLLCAVGLLPVALCYSEAASSVDRSGGPYVYTSAAFGPLSGFAVGWMCFANGVFSYAAVALAAAANLGRLVAPLGSAGAVKVAAVVIVALFAWLNYRGSKPGAVAIDVFTIGKFAVLVVLLLALLPHTSFANASTELPRGVGGVGTATFIALFAVQGFETVPVPAGETKGAQRSVPIAVITSLLAASFLYVLVQLILVGSYPHLEVDSKTPLADAAMAVVPALGVVIAVGALISTLGFVSGSALGTPRYLFAAASDGHLHRSLATVHTRFESPHRATVVTALLACALVLGFDYRALIGMSNVAVAVQYFGTCVAVLRLRSAGVKAGFRIPGGPVVPVLGALVSLAILREATLEELGWAGASLAIGLGALAIFRKR